MPVSSPEVTAPAVRTAGGAGPSSVARWVRVAALVMVAVQVGIRWRLLAGRDYYSDDFRLLHLADVGSLWSWSYLSTDYDGQFMPGALLLAGIVERVGPLEWWAAATTLVVMQALASLALLRLLRLLLGDRPLLLVPLTFGLFTPLTLGSTTWWAAGLNSLPLQIGLACFLAEAVLLTRTGARRHALRGTLVFALTLPFYVKAVILPWVGFGIVVLLLLRESGRFSPGAALRRASSLWLGSLVVTGVWAVAYLRTRGRDPVNSGGLDGVVETIRAGLRVLAASLFGGPADWSTEPPWTPIAAPQPWAVAAGGGLLLLAFAWTCLRRRGALAVWVLVAAEVTVGLVLAAAARGALGLADVLPLACRYYAAESVVLPVAAALLATMPSRHARRGADQQCPPRTPRWAVAATAAATALFCAVALLTTVQYARAWRTDPSGAYLAAARASLAEAGPAPMLDQQLPGDVLWTLFFPSNQLSTALSPLADRPPVEAWTSDLRVLDQDGHLRAAEVEPGVTVLDGPAPGCGWPVAAGADTAVDLSGPILSWEWTARLDYVAARDGWVTVVMATDGAPVRAPVRAGDHTLFLRITGGGPALRVTAETPDLGLCVDDGAVGDVVLR